MVEKTLGAAVPAGYLGCRLSTNYHMAVTNTYLGHLKVFWIIRILEKERGERDHVAVPCTHLGLLKMFCMVWILEKERGEREKSEISKILLNGRDAHSDTTCAVPFAPKIFSI